MLARKIAPALAAGCTVVVKVSGSHLFSATTRVDPHRQPPAETPFTALALGEVGVAESTLTYGMLS